MINICSYLFICKFVGQPPATVTFCGNNYYVEINLGLGLQDTSCRASISLST